MKLRGHSDNIKALIVDDDGTRVNCDVSDSSVLFCEF